ncbi:MAG: hypothetical protein D6707_10390 [Bacteroidetes bacterium]|nr:MAG: hypothetical protein D6707_10390 [Bacteroidota bacterium]
MYEITRNIISHVHEHCQVLGYTIFIPLILLILVGIVGQWTLYEKCGQKGIDSIIPLVNVVTFLKIVERPVWHTWLVIIPPVLVLVLLTSYETHLATVLLTASLLLFWIGYMISCYVKLCKLFNKTKWYDYLFIIIFNGFYVLHLGLSHKEKYKNRQTLSSFIPAEEF